MSNQSDNRVVILFVESDFLSQRVLMWEILLCQSLIDDRDLLCRSPVCRREFAASQNRNPQGAEVSCRHYSDVRVRTGIARRSLPPLDFKRGLASLARERQCV